MAFKEAEKLLSEYGFVEKPQPTRRTPNSRVRYYINADHQISLNSDGPWLYYKGMFDNRYTSGYDLKDLKYHLDKLNTKIQFGNHLATVRNWIQWNAINGDRVTWGSEEFLQLKPVTVLDMENLAQAIRNAVLEEVKNEISRRF